MHQGVAYNFRERHCGDLKEKRNLQMKERREMHTISGDGESRIYEDDKEEKETDDEKGEGRMNL